MTMIVKKNVNSLYDIDIFVIDLMSIDNMKLQTSIQNNCTDIGW